MKKHSEFIEDVKHFNSLPSKTARALGPESEEDIAIYLQEHDNLTGNAKKELNELTKKAISDTDKIMKDNNIEKLTKEQIKEINTNMEDSE